MKRHFDAELNNLNESLLHMADLAKEAIQKAVQALTDRDSSLAEEVISNDAILDNQELVIEDQCLNLLALHQPQATDLRFVTNTSKITYDLERIGDLAVDIARRTLELSNYPPLMPFDGISELAKTAQKMVKNAIEAYASRDPDLAKDILVMNRGVKSKRNKIQDKIIFDYLVKDGSVAPQAIPLVLVLRHLERTCRHASNVAEDVIHIFSAKVVKHREVKA